MEPIKTPSAQYAFTAVRDEAGVPHVEAESWREALYALGYLHATDRPTQIVFARTVASGRAAERIANTPELTETDIFFRRAGLFRHLDREVASTPRVDAVRRGVLLRTASTTGSPDAGRSLPMWVTGFRPKPWDAQAVLLIGNLLSFAGLAVGQQENERLLLELVQLGIDDDRIRELFDAASRRYRLRNAPRDQDAEPTFGRGARTDRRSAAARRQQRVGRRAGAERVGIRALCVRSAFGSEPAAGDLVRGRLQMGQGAPSGGRRKGTGSLQPAVCRSARRCPVVR